MSNEDFDFDPSIPPNVADPAGAMIRRQQQRSLINAWGDSEDDPGRASRAMDLSRSTGVAPALIYGDQENFEEQHRIALTSELLRNNKFLMDYAADPMAAKVSRDDWGKLDEYTTALTRTTSSVGHAALAAAREHFDLQHALGADQLPPDWVSNHRLLFSLATGAYGLALGLPMEAFGAGLEGLKAGAEELQVQMGVPRSTAASSSREMVGMVQAELMRLSGAPRIPPEALAPGLRAAEKARPYVERGELPPTGIDSLIDEAHKLQAKQDDKAGKAAISAAHATATIDTPEAFEALSRQVVGEQKIGISAQAIAKLYGDEPPAAGDGKLGDLPAVREQYEMALRTGKDVEVPLAEWMSRTEPEVKEELREGLRWRSGGMTLEESKRPAPKVEEAEEETIASAAVKLKDGQVFTGPTHSEAIDAAIKATGGGVEFAPKGQGLFQTSTGRIIDHRESLSLPAVRRELGLPPSMVDSVREASGLVPKGWEAAGAAAVEPGIVPNRTLIGEAIGYPEMGTYSALHSFPASEALQGLDKKRLTGVPRALAEFFGEKLKQLAGDTPVHVLSDADMAALQKAMGKSKAGPAFYEHNNHHIVMNETTATGGHGYAYAARVMMHEAAHALTSRALEDFPLLRSHVRAMMDETLEKIEQFGLSEDRKAYGFKNEHEFVAEAFSNPRFQELLALTPISKNLAGRLGLKTNRRTAWDAVKGIIRDLIDRLTGHRTPDTILDGLLHLGPSFERAHKLIESAERGFETQEAPPLEPELPGLTRMEDRPLFERARLIGLSKARYAKWVEAVNKRGEEKAKLEKDRELKEEGLRQSAEWKASFKEARKTVDDEVRSRPDFAADRFLREGGEIGGQHVRKQRLDAALIPEEFRGRLPEGYVGDRGLNPDHVASIFGFNNGRSLLTSLTRLEDERKLAGLTPEAHLRTVIDAETERRVRGELGDSQREIMKEIEDHVYSPATIDMISEEVLGMAEKAGAQLPITGDNAKAWVREQFTAGKMGTHSFKAYQSAAQRAELRITDALLEGRENDAFQDYQRKYVSMLAANEARKLEREQAKADVLFKRLLKRVVEGLPEEFTNYLHQLMGRGGFNFGPGGIRRSEADLAERINAHDWPDFSSFTKHVAEDLGFPIQVPDFLFTPWAKPQELMTVSEWRDWSGMIRSLYNSGRQTKTFEAQGRQLDLDEFVQKTREQVEEFWGSDRAKIKNPTRLQELPGQAQALAYRLIWLESVWNRFDLGNKYGTFNTAFSFPASKAANQYSVWVKEFSKELDSLERSHIADRTLLPEIFKDREGNPITDLNHDNLRQALLYAGSNSGYRKLIEGWMLADIPKEQREAAFPLAAQRFETWIHDNATKEDWEYVEKIWDINKRIFDKYETMVTNLGVVPARKVSLRPWTDAFGGKHEGGYQKLIYDPEEFQPSSKAAGATMYDPEDPMGGSGFFQASTPRSHEKERTGYVGPLYLKTDRNPGAMSNVLRDAALRPFIVNTAKIFNNPEFRNMLDRNGFGHVKDMLDPYLRSMAGMGERVEESARLLDRLINFFSASTVGRLIGWNFQTAEKHGLSAGVNSIAEVGVKNFTREFVTIKRRGDLHPTMSNEEFAMSRSQELQRRSRSILETLGGQVERLAGARTGYQRVGDWFAEKGPAIVAWADLKSAIPTWTAAYKDSIIEQAQEFGDVNLGLAEDIADRAVRRAHGSTSVATRPAAMRGGAIAQTFVRLYGFWNTIFQRNYEAMWRTKYAMEQFEKKDYEAGLKQIPAITWLVVSGNLAPAIIEYAVDPYPTNEKDSTPVKVTKAFALAASGMIPGVREAVHAWISGYPTTMGILDTGWKGIADAVHDLGRGAKALDAEHGGKTIKALNSVFATFTRISNDEIGRMLKTMWDVTHQSKETPKTPYEFLMDLKRGHPREQHR